MGDSAKQPAPEPGIYHDVPFDEYKRWDALNASTLIHGRVSMLRLKAALDGELPDNDSKDRNFGSAAHCMILEGIEAFNERYKVSQPCCSALKTGPNKGKPCGKESRYVDESELWYCGSHRPKESSVYSHYVSPKEHRRLERMNHFIRRHNSVAMLRARGGCEVSFVADIHGVRCKGRLDKLIPETKQAYPTILDVKTIREGRGSKEHLRQDILKYGYHVKAAFYIAGVRQHIKADYVDFDWVFIEKKPPYDIHPIEADELDLLIAKDELRILMRDYKQAMESGLWPGYQPDVTSGALPEKYKDARQGQYA